MKVIITPKALKQYKHLPISEQVKIQKKLMALATDSHMGKKLSGQLQESRVLRVWPYRIIYYINHERNAVFVISIIHRQGAYS